MANNLFFSDIGKDTYKSLYKRVISLDRDISSYERRSKIVNDIIEDNQYLVNYFSSYYSPVLTNDSALSSENNICQLVEILTNYLLTSTESRELDDKQRTIYINTASFNKSNDIPIGDSTEFIKSSQTAYVEFNSGNYKKDKRQTITPKDLSRTDYLGSVLRDYQSLLDTINVKLHSPTDGRRMLYTRTKHDLKDDQIISKDSLLGVWGYTTHPSESTGHVDYTTFNDQQTVKTMLKNVPSHGDKDVWLLSLDFETLLSKIQFSPYELALIFDYRQGSTLAELSQDLGRSRTTIFNDISHITEKITTKTVATAEEITGTL